MTTPGVQFQFPNSRGETLSGRLELPTGSPRAYAIFAHCFTCSKNVHAASRISRALSQRGLAVLRFDFTGLGNSEGDFANTNFSSNVEDLVAAAQALQREHRAPSLLIGHSLGGAAVLAAAAAFPMSLQSQRSALPASRRTSSVCFAIRFRRSRRTVWPTCGWAAANSR